MDKDLALAFEKSLDQGYFLGCGVLDWTNGKPAKVVLKSQAGWAIDEFWLPSNLLKLKELCGGLNYYLSRPNSILIGWDIKNLFSFMLAKLKSPFRLESKIIDLKILERYVGINEEMPTTYKEAKTRLEKIVSLKSWKSLKNIYSEVYLPLVQTVFPQIESVGILDCIKRKHLYSSYDIVGQINGRTKCSLVFADSYNPHSLTEENKSNFKSPGFDNTFIYFDYKHMEVSMLQWLSGDPKLGSIIDSGVDVYEGIWTALTKMKPTPELRSKCKNIFLPVVFGQGIKSLAEKTGWPEAIAEKMVNKIFEVFPVAMGWIRKQQDEGGKQAVDVFGRKREVDEAYKKRNFSVQSPASLFCLKKLVVLHNAIKKYAEIGYHLHDGYMLFSPIIEKTTVIKLAKEALESEDHLFPGLKLKVACQVGVKLNNLKEES